MPDNLIVKAHVPEMYLRELGFNHEKYEDEIIRNKDFTRTEVRHETLEFCVDGYLGWWVYYRNTRTIVLNIVNPDYQSHRTYKTRNEIIDYLKKEDEFDEEHRKLPNFIYPKGYVSWVKRYKLDEILKICIGDE